MSKKRGSKTKKFIKYYGEEYVKNFEEEKRKKGEREKDPPEKHNF